MAEKEKDDKKQQPIIVKKIKKGGGHHGGAWKVAYADFVTAMMAFFLLLWLLNVTTDEQKNAISNYFDPTHPKVSDSTSGAGGVLGGLTMSPQGAMTSSANPLTPQEAVKTKTKLKKTPDGQEKSEKAKAREKAEESRYKKIEEEIKKAIEKSPELAALKNNLIIDMTPEGLRIQIVDQEGQPMFPSGSAVMYDKTRMLLEKITEIILEMPNKISIRGHTDSIAYAKDATYTNWELSSDRANASRRVMMEALLPPERINNVVGKADMEHLIADKPQDPRNRRISIILLKQDITDPLPAEPRPATQKAGKNQKDTKNGETTGEESLLDTLYESEEADEKDGYFEEDDGTGEYEEGGGEESEDDSISVPPRMAPIGTFQKTPGQVEFP